MLQNTVGDGLVEGSHLPIGVDVELQGLQFYASRVGNIFEIKGGKIRLPGFRAQAGEFGNIDPNRIISCRAGVVENLEPAAGIVISICLDFCAHLVPEGEHRPDDVLRRFLLYTTPCAQTMGFVDRVRMNWFREGSRIDLAGVGYGFLTGKLALSDVGGVRAALRAQAAIK